MDIKIGDEFTILKGHLAGHYKVNRVVPVSRIYGEGIAIELENIDTKDIGMYTSSSIEELIERGEMIRGIHPFE